MLTGTNQKEHWPLHKTACRALKDNLHWPTMDTIQDIQKEMMTPLHGVYAPASERIRWHSIHEQNEITGLVNGYIEQLDKEQVAQYATEKFLESGKGAVMFNINHPVMQHDGSARFFWSGLGALEKTGDAVMAQMGND
ncbi:hypothetical protein FRC03_005435 [Tulasnella sp. 419]|nr:hypothetical protein FRC03_005435 [Tulasnella sp. 419]